MGIPMHDPKEITPEELLNILRNLGSEDIFASQISELITNLQNIAEALQTEHSTDVFFYYQSFTYIENNGQGEKHKVTVYEFTNTKNKQKVVEIIMKDGELNSIVVANDPEKGIVDGKAMGLYWKPDFQISGYDISNDVIITTGEFVTAPRLIEGKGVVDGVFYKLSVPNNAEVYLYHLGEHHYYKRLELIDDVVKK